MEDSGVGVCVVACTLDDEAYGYCEADEEEGSACG